MVAKSRAARTVLSVLTRSFSFSWRIAYKLALGRGLARQLVKSKSRYWWSQASKGNEHVPKNCSACSRFLDPATSDRCNITVLGPVFPKDPGAPFSLSLLLSLPMRQSLFWGLLPLKDLWTQRVFKLWQPKVYCLSYHSKHDKATCRHALPAP